jgi:hypothetical protein
MEGAFQGPNSILHPLQEILYLDLESSQTLGPFGENLFHFTPPVKNGLDFLSGHFFVHFLLHFFGPGRFIQSLSHGSLLLGFPCPSCRESVEKIDIRTGKVLLVVQGAKKFAPPKSAEYLPSSKGLPLNPQGNARMLGMSPGRHNKISQQHNSGPMHAGLRRNQSLILASEFLRSLDMGYRPSVSLLRIFSHLRWESGNIFGPGRTPFEIRTAKVFLIYRKGISPAREKSLSPSAGSRILPGRAVKRTCHMLKNRIRLFRFPSHTPRKAPGRAQSALARKLKLNPHRRTSE